MSHYSPDCNINGDVAQMEQRTLSRREVKRIMSTFSTVVIDNIVVNMSACHADNPGSILGRGVKVFVFHHHNHKTQKNKKTLWVIS